MAKAKMVEFHDDENPEWTAKDFARAKPAKDMLPPDVYEGLTKKRGRPPKADAKQQVTLRLPPDVLEPFKASGQGWQTRIEDTLRTALKKGLAAGIASSRARAPARAAKRNAAKAAAVRRARSA